MNYEKPKWMSANEFAEVMRQDSRTLFYMQSGESDNELLPVYLSANTLDDLNTIFDTPKEGWHRLLATEYCAHYGAVTKAGWDAHLIAAPKRYKRGGVQWHLPVQIVDDIRKELEYRLDFYQQNVAYGDSSYEEVGHLIAGYKREVKNVTKTLADALSMDACDVGR